MRLFGIALLSLIPIIIGFMKAKNSALAVRQNELILLMIGEIDGLIRYQAMPLDEIFGIICSEDIYKPLGFDCWSVYDEPFGVRMRKYIEDDSKLKISADEKAAFMLFLTALGKSDDSGQRAICKTYTAKFQTYIDQRRESAPKNQKLCRSIGIICGIFIAIILI